MKNIFAGVINLSNIMLGKIPRKKTMKLWQDNNVFVLHLHLPPPERKQDCRLDGLGANTQILRSCLSQVVLVTPIIVITTIANKVKILTINYLVWKQE